ncbi:FxLYD domain-containing protein [Streptomyces sp. WAC07094]|uniref:FxLYD domain-containing protein n=1 Tax=Streptomyces sp. WAC07094 TaxID=3072183 RepID=UPI002EBAA190|nr:FxLYD domain-containing protein [Streptomyces sp. WAC07094]
MNADEPGAEREPRRPGVVLAATSVALAALGAASLVSCTNNNDNGGRTVSPRPTPPNTASFSGTPPSALASLAQSAEASARASASAAESSLSARASEFEASVSADTARNATTAENELKHVQGRGNALSDVSMSGMPRTQTGGVLAVLLTITNNTDQKASYAVQVDFEDAEGRVVETRYAGAQNLAPGQKEQPIAFSRQPAEPKLTPRLVKAQRY